MQKQVKHNKSHHIKSCQHNLRGQNNKEIKLNEQNVK